MAGMTTSPQLRASPEARNVQGAVAAVDAVAGGAFWAARTSQPEAGTAMASIAAHRRRCMGGILPRLSCLPSDPGGQRAELDADDAHLKRVGRMCVEDVEVPVADAQLAKDIVSHARRPPEPLLERVHHVGLVAGKRGLILVP